MSVVGAKKICIVGGVAGGASAAARLRRLCETSQIKVFEKGPFASFANCGLPYRVGNVITDDAKLIVASPQLFANRFNIEVKTLHEVVRVNREAKTITVKSLADNKEFDEAYDKLIIAVGANAIRPPIPGIDNPNIFVLRNIPDMNKIMDRLKRPNIKRAVIIGGGFIGLEMADNLRHIGLNVTLIEKLPQLMPVVNQDFANKLKFHMEDKGVEIVLEDAVTSFESLDESGALRVNTEKGRILETDLVMLCIGTSPASDLAKSAGLDLGFRGGVKVDNFMRTNDKDIFSVGDVIETTDFVTGQKTNVPLAGPANRQGRLAADAICNPLGLQPFRGVQGTSICKVFDIVIASTGATELSLKRANIDFLAIDIHPGNHVSYFPGAQQMSLRLLFSPRDGKILGAQGVGYDGVDTRIDVIAMAIQMGATVYHLTQAELCYSPQFGAAKDPINMLGFVAVNILEGRNQIADKTLIPHHSESEEDSKKDRPVVLDVRSRGEYGLQHIPGAENIPLEELRSRIADVVSLIEKRGYANGKMVLVTCQVGQRAHYATQILRQNGIDARIITGGMISYCMREGIRLKTA